MRWVYHSKWSLGFIITLPVSSHQKHKERIVPRQNNSSTNASCYRVCISTQVQRFSTHDCEEQQRGCKNHMGIMSFSCRNRTVKVISLSLKLQLYWVSCFFSSISYSFHCRVSICAPCNIYSSLSLNISSKRSAAQNKTLLWTTERRFWVTDSEGWKTAYGK